LSSVLFLLPAAAAAAAAAAGPSSATGTVGQSNCYSPRGARSHQSKFVNRPVVGKVVQVACATAAKLRSSEHCLLKEVLCDLSTVLLFWRNVLLVLWMSIINGTSWLTAVVVRWLFLLAMHY
jgi:hypothetical protein